MTSPAPTRPPGPDAITSTPVRNSGQQVTACGHLILLCLLLVEETLQLGTLHSYEPR